MIDGAGAAILEDAGTDVAASPVSDSIIAVVVAVAEGKDSSGSSSSLS